MSDRENIRTTACSYSTFLFLIAAALLLIPRYSFSRPSSDKDIDHTPVNYSFSIADSLALLYHVTDLDERYTGLILKAEWAEKYGKFEIAKSFYQQASALKPVENLPYQRIDKIEARQKNRRINISRIRLEFDRSTLLIKILLLVIIYSGISMIILLFVILFNRNRMERETRLRQELKEKYQNLLLDYLFTEEEDNEVPARIDKIAADRFKRVILVEEMKDLIVNLSGDAANKLRKLYYKLNLDVDSRLRALSKKWHIKVKGFRELAFMNIKEANEEIIRCLHSNNSLLRMEAQLALVRLNDEDRFSFLDFLKRPFTKWEQLNVHEMILSHDLEIPDFERWLDSQNPTVVQFSMRMIKIFNQKKAWEKIAGLLDSDDPEIRRTAIYVLGELRIKQAVSSLKHKYKSEVYENLLEIIIALRKISDESVINFLMIVIDKEDDVQLQIEAAKALRDMGDTGNNALEKLLQSDYKNYQIIIKHVLDKRI